MYKVNIYLTLVNLAAFIFLKQTLNYVLQIGCFGGINTDYGKPLLLLSTQVFPNKRSGKPFGFLDKLRFTNSKHVERDHKKWSLWSLGTIGEIPRNTE